MPHTNGGRQIPWSWRQITRRTSWEGKKDRTFWLVYFFTAEKYSQSAVLLKKQLSIVENMANLRCHLCCALLFLFISKSVCFKPVIIVHGILDHASDMKDLASFITQAHPGTNITLIKLFEERDSFKPLWMQVSAMTEKIRPVMQDAKYGVHIIGFSQGIS